jgi:DNA-binding transcriptional ArsR family regulator
VHAFDVLGDPVRRLVIELLADSELTSGEITAKVQERFQVSQPGVSQHLRVLRDSGFASVRPDGTRRVYSLDARPLAELDAWLQPYRRFWAQRLDALDTEIRRGRRKAT